MGSITSRRPKRLKSIGFNHAFLLIAAFLILLPAAALWSDTLKIDGEIYTGTWITPSATPIPPILIAEKNATGFVEEIDGVLWNGVTGEVCVQNAGTLPTEGLEIIDTIQMPANPVDYIDIKTEIIDVSEHPVLEPGETYCYAYLIYFAIPIPEEPSESTGLPDETINEEQIEVTEIDTSLYVNKADVTILNHAEWLPGDPNCPGPEACPYGPTVYAPFTLPEPTPEPTEEPTETPTPPHHGQSGTTLEATKTATGFQEYRNGVPVTGVFGEICVTNGGEIATQSLTIVDTIEVKTRDAQSEFEPYATEMLDMSEKPILEPGESHCYTYEILFTLPEEKVIYRNAVTVTITNHSGWIPGGHHCPGPDLCPFGPTTRAGFEIPEPEMTPTPVPTELEPTEEPTEVPTEELTEEPTEEPTEAPTEEPPPTP